MRFYFFFLFIILYFICRHDISDAIRELGFRLDSAADFELRIKLKAVNGSYIDADLLPRPSIMFQPGEGDYGYQKHFYNTSELQTENELYAERITSGFLCILSFLQRLENFSN